MLKATIRGLQEAQAKNAEMIGALQPKGALGEAVKYAVTDLHRYEVTLMHVGRYKQSARGTYYYSRTGGVGGGAMRASLRKIYSGHARRDRPIGRCRLSTRISRP